MNFFKTLFHKPLKLWPYFAAAAAAVGGGFAASSFIAGSSVAAGGVAAGGMAASGAAMAGGGSALVGGASMASSVGTVTGSLGLGAKLASAAKTFSGLAKSIFPLVTNFFSGAGQNSSAPEQPQTLTPYTGIGGTLPNTGATLIPIPVNQGGSGFFMPTPTETQEAGFDFSSIFRMPYILIVIAIGILLFIRMRRGK